MRVEREGWMRQDQVCQDEPRRTVVFQVCERAELVGDLSPERRIGQPVHLEEPQGRKPVCGRLQLVQADCCTVAAIGQRMPIFGGRIAEPHEVELIPQPLEFSDHQRVVDEYSGADAGPRLLQRSSMGPSSCH